MYPSELPAIPEQVRSLFDALAQSTEGMDAAQLMAAADLSERGFGKAIRRLVTLRLVNMPASGLYALTERGRAVARAASAQTPGMASGEMMPATAPDVGAEEALVAPEAAQVPPPASQPVAALRPGEQPQGHAQRQLSVLVAEEMAAGLGTILMAGLNAPPHGTPSGPPQTVTLRVTAPGCEIDPAEQPLEVSPDAATGPVRFKVTASQPGLLRISLEILPTPDGEARVRDGMYFDVRVQPFPTPRTAEFRTLGAVVRLPR